MLRILMKILSYTSVKKKTKRLNGFRFHTFIGHSEATSWQWKGLKSDKETVRQAKAQMDRQGLYWQTDSDRVKVWQRDSEAGQGTDGQTGTVLADRQW